MAPCILEADLSCSNLLSCRTPVVFTELHPHITYIGSKSFASFFFPSHKETIICNQRWSPFCIKTLSFSASMILFLLQFLIIKARLTCSQEQHGFNFAVDFIFDGLLGIILLELCRIYTGQTIRKFVWIALLHCSKIIFHGTIDKHPEFFDTIYNLFCPLFLSKCL